MEYMLTVLFWTVLFGFYVEKGTAASYTLDISSYNPQDVKTHTSHIFVSQFDGNSSEIIVSSNATNRSGFYVLQAHSFHYNVTLSRYSEIVQNVTGHNVGFVQFFKDPFVISYFLEKLTDKNTTILIAITIYNPDAPIPGGCVNTKSSSTVNDPSIQVMDGEDIITIMSESPSVTGLSCDTVKNETQVEIYHKYLSSQNFDPFVYYEGIRSMLSIEDIRSNGKLVSSLKAPSNIEKLFSSYIGVGEVFSILITRNGKTSSYIPAVSYGQDIDILIKKEKAGISGRDLFVTLFSVLPFIAFIIIYWGHSLFHFTAFALGLSCGTIISFFFMSKEGASSIDDKFLISLIIGFIYGTVWVCIWYKCGIPILSASLAFLHAGGLIACICYHIGLADLEDFHKDGLYWSVFSGIVIACWFVLCVLTMHGHIFSCAFLGSYILMITTLNYWMGGNLQYVVINVYRRMFVPNFNSVVLDPPFQARDHFIVFCGLFFLLHGFYKQVKNQVGKPPFPPHNSRRFGAETTPLLSGF